MSKNLSSLYDEKHISFFTCVASGFNSRAVENLQSTDTPTCFRLISSNSNTVFIRADRD